jgi:hypothetical protein
MIGNIFAAVVVVVVGVVVIEISIISIIIVIVIVVVADSYWRRESIERAGVGENVGK